jgi:ankyrin repeat protein
MSQKFIGLAIAAGRLAGPVFAQPSKVDFGRDVLPIFRQNCFACHGPAQATSGLRLDRKSSVFKEGARRVVPGSSQNSFLYHRLAGTDFGMQMPPTGQLRVEQIATIKAWIEQGAEWPDKLSNEAERAPLDPQAVAAVEILRTGNTQGFLKAMSDNPRLLNARGPESSTPFMYAALYGDAAMLEQLLKSGANPNLKNDAGATALLWAATDLDKTRVLLAHGAEVNIISEDVRTPLMIAAGVPTGRPIVKLLLEHGANVNPTRHPDGESSPLVEAAFAADPEMMQLLIDHGADVKASAAAALVMALAQDCGKCADLLMKQNLDAEAYTVALPQVAGYVDAKTIRALLDHGAKVDTPDPLGHTALAYAAGSDLAPAEVVNLLIERGADVNSKSPHQSSGDTGMTVLDIARLRGETPVTAVLVKAGATSAVGGVKIPNPQPAGSVRTAIERSLPLLQRADAGFTAKSGCISCHNDSLTAMTVSLARDRGFPVNEKLSAQQLKVNAASLEHLRDNFHQSFAGEGTDTIGPLIFAYILMGLQAEHYPADLNTDAVAMYIKAHQMPDGHWPYLAADSRPPLCSDYLGQTVKAMRALQLYAPKAYQAEYERAVGLASAWLAKADAKTTEDYVWKLQGLAWAARDKDAIGDASRQLLALQRGDGGWADLPSLSSNAYATGRTLVALQSAGLAVSDPMYRRGMEFLLKNQLADGSWFVRTRALGFQPYFETGFPHGVNQSISAAATNWATMALILGSPSPAGKTESRADAR